MFTASKSKRAKKATKKAAKRAEQAGAHAQERAAEFAERAGARAQETASEVADRLRHSDALAKAQARSSEFASLARDKWRDSHMDDRVADLAENVRGSDAYKHASKRTKRATEDSLAALGGWLSKGKSAELLGVKERRRWPLWVVGVLSMGVGFVAARLMGSRSGSDVRDDFIAAADRLQTEPPPSPEASESEGASQSPPNSMALADEVRSTLDRDPRTTGFSDLAINVAEGTVFVRGNVPADADEGAIREVIADVPGVHDVDLQLTTAS